MQPIITIQSVVDELDKVSDGITVYMNKHTGEFVMVTEDDLFALENKNI